MSANLFYATMLQNIKAYYSPKRRKHDKRFRERFTISDMMMQLGIITKLLPYKIAFKSKAEPPLNACSLPVT